MYTFSTTDFQLGAYALCKGMKLIRIDRTNRKAIFIFEVEFTEHDISNSFWSNESVPVEDFVTAQSQLKKRLFSDSF